jgi:glycosyltransferase involved in cell wall biosynthesis
MRKTILYIKPVNSSFILTDQHILEKEFHVRPFLVKQSYNKGKFLVRLILLSFFILKNLFRADALVCWFGDYHTAIMVFFAKIAGKKSMVFAGGQEAVCYPELGKGVYRKKIRGFLVKYALRNCTLILPNHPSLIYHENCFYNPRDPHIDGIRHYVKGIKTRFEVVPNGIDTSRIDRNPEIKKEPGLVLTVGTMNHKGDFINKGFDLFIEVARKCPDLKFVLIGLKRQYLDWTEAKYKVSEIENLKIIPFFCPGEILVEYFNKASVYVQISITEGMPVSLGEAMLCECIPIGSNVNGIPDAIGNTGIVVTKRDVISLEDALRKALSMDTGREARKYTLSNFSIARREKKILELFRQNI